MTIMRARFTVGAGGPAASRAALRYAVLRPDHDGQRVERAVFGPDGLDVASIRAQLDAARGDHHYRLVLNPGAGQHPVDQRDWTRDVMAAVAEGQAKEVPWLAVEHRNQSQHDHVHIVAATERRLTRVDLPTLREVADSSWERHADWARALDLDAVQEPHQQQPERLRALSHTGGWDQ
ncbi:hypothetical protein [Deinococcus sp. AJ005]|uniref:hypothetical protein n=1 Tax=Deinococcus sp. AJ005 TaxID=2652443 RepID=UPI00125CABDA|nr:hypothetical protein [Deinococcus sp. AJ005]QFP75718.1 hypothetical protein DAAJ005_04020 [Deinococcus sp. AJ005]